jgi:hypothetical protein
MFCVAPPLIEPLYRVTAPIDVSLRLLVEIGVSDMISRTFAPSDGPAVIKAASSRKYPA